MAQRQMPLLVAVAFFAGMAGGIIGTRIFPASSPAVVEVRALQLVGDGGQVFAHLSVDRVAFSRTQEYDRDGKPLRSDSLYVERPRFELLDGNGKVVWAAPMATELLPLAQM